MWRPPSAGDKPPGGPRLRGPFERGGRPDGVGALDGGFCRAAGADPQEEAESGQEKGEGEVSPVEAMRLNFT
jgi:hypothetical protein